MGVEHENVGVGQILGFVASIIVTLALMIIFVFNLVNVSEQRTLEARVASGNYPELRETEAEATNKLTQYEILNDQEAVYRIPVDRAMDLMVQQSRTDTTRTYSPELQLRPGN